MVDIETLTDPAELRTVCRAYEASHRVLVDRITRLAKIVAELQGLDAAQAFLEFPDIEIVEPAPDQAPAPPVLGRPKEEKPENRDRKPQTGHGPDPQPNLPREALEHRLDEEPECPACGGEMKLFEGQYEESEEITVVETSFKVLCHRRAKYRCSCHGAVLTAPGPDKLIPGGRYSVDFAVHSAVEKFADHSVPRKHAHQPQGRRSKLCCMEDEGRPLGIGVQAQVSNHLELLGSRVRVVSVDGKGAARSRQVRSKKTSVSEPLMTCREVFTRRRNRAVWLARDEPRESLLIDWVASGMKAA